MIKIMVYLHILLSKRSCKNKCQYTKYEVVETYFSNNNYTKIKKYFLNYILNHTFPSLLEGSWGSSGCALVVPASVQYTEILKPQMGQLLFNQSPINGRPKPEMYRSSSMQMNAGIFCNIYILDQQRPILYTFQCWPNVMHSKMSSTLNNTIVV